MSTDQDAEGEPEDDVQAPAPPAFASLGHADADDLETQTANQKMQARIKASVAKDIKKMLLSSKAYVKHHTPPPHISPAKLSALAAPRPALMHPETHLACMLKDPIEYARLKTEQLKATRQKQDQEAQEEAKAAAVLQKQLHGFQLWRQQRKELKASIEQAAAKEDKQYGAALSKYVAYKAQTELARRPPDPAPPRPAAPRSGTRCHRAVQGASHTACPKEPRAVSPIHSQLLQQHWAPGHVVLLTHLQRARAQPTAGACRRGRGNSGRGRPGSSRHGHAALVAALRPPCAPGGAGCRGGNEPGEWGARVACLQAADLVVVGSWHQVAEALASVTCPVMYLEQGHEQLGSQQRPPGGEQQQASGARLGEREAVLFSAMMRLPALLAAVSPSVAQTLSHRFDRLSLLVPNGIDTGQWMGAQHDPGPGLAPAPLLHPDPAGEARPGQPQYRVLLVGHPGLAIKDFPTALAVLQSVSQALGRLHVTWVCQAEPPPVALDWCGPSVTWKLEVTPPQDALPALFHGHHALLMTSRSEGWSLPVLEAMASGVPPVITACGGPEAFALHEYNCLLAQVGDVAGLAACLARVLTDPALARRLAVAGKVTAQHYDLQRMGAAMLQALRACVACRLECALARSVMADAILEACRMACEAADEAAKFAALA
ncbi:hypothetical protein QJQ45_026304 [Haematococcus lacustris]|nr:hypothetical protein QJQ45_026304 [Haematococcus lacustris]